MSEDTLKIKISRIWAMPNHETFKILPIKNLIEKWGFTSSGLRFVDPFVRNSPFKGYCISNDIDPEIEADSHVDALEFLKTFESGTVDGVLFDPPYSPRQVAEVYKRLELSVNMQTTQSRFWGDMKKEVSRIMVYGGTCITCGWNSGGMGKSNGFEISEILMVPHGGWHNDTIVVVENKI